MREYSKMYNEVYFSRIYNIYTIHRKNTMDKEVEDNDSEGLSNRGINRNKNGRQNNKKYKNRMIENDTGVGRVVCIQCELYKLAGGED